MLDLTPIQSSANAVVKRVRAVRRGSERGLMVLDGERLVSDALAHGLTPEVVLLAERRLDRAREIAREDVEVRVLSDGLFDSVSSLSTSTGVLALARVPEPLDLDQLPTGRDALVVVVAGVQDPGNLGALARTAEAAGVSALVTASGGCSPWSEKALRGSMGSLLRLAVYEVDTLASAWKALSDADYRQVVARTRAGRDFASFDWSGRVALWVPAESGTMPDEIADRIEGAEGVTIPMAGKVESLNVTTAAALLLYAAKRVPDLR